MFKKNPQYFSSIILGILLLIGCSTGQKITRIPPNPTTSSATQQKITISEFILGPGDELEIMVWRQEDLHQTVKITPSGKLIYPLVGDLSVQGMSLIELRNLLQKRLARYVHNPQVSITVKSSPRRKVFVLGEVHNPGVFQYDSSMSALQAIAQAGGFTSDAKKGKILLFRGGVHNPKVATLNLDEVLKKGNLSGDSILEQGDILYIPPSFVANLERFARHLTTILGPILQIETGIVLGGDVEDTMRNERRGINGGSPGGVFVPPPSTPK
jgi:polysaccharide export outer membrane protein